MDLQKLERSIASLSLQSVPTTAKLCSDYCDSASLALFVIENEFLSARKERKRLYLTLIANIIQEEKKIKRLDYIKLFGGKLKKLFQDFQHQVDSIEDFEEAYKIIKKWEIDYIYHPLFLDKLRDLLQPKYDMLISQQHHNNQLQNQDIESSKILIKNIEIIENIESASKVYKHLKSLKECDEKCLDFNQQFEYYESQVIKERVENFEKVDDLVQIGELCVESISKNTCNTQTIFFELNKEAEQLYQEIQKCDKEQVAYEQYNKTQNN